jgi:hypothetical protein
MEHGDQKAILKAAEDAATKALGEGADKSAIDALAQKIISTSAKALKDTSTLEKLMISAAAAEATGIPAGMIGAGGGTIISGWDDQKSFDENLRDLMPAAVNSAEASILPSAGTILAFTAGSTVVGWAWSNVKGDGGGAGGATGDKTWMYKNTSGQDVVVELNGQKMTVKAGDTLPLGANPKFSIPATDTQAAAEPTEAIPVTKDAPASSTADTQINSPTGVYKVGDTGVKPSLDFHPEAGDTILAATNDSVIINHPGMGNKDAMIGIPVGSADASGVYDSAGKRMNDYQPVQINGKTYYQNGEDVYDFSKLSENAKPQLFKVQQWQAVPADSMANYLESLVDKSPVVQTAKNGIEIHADSAMAQKPSSPAIATAGAANDALNALPQATQDLLAKSGVRVAVVNERLGTSDGFYDPKTNTIFLAPGADTATIREEIWHAIDHAKGNPSTSDRLTGAYNLDTQNHPNLSNNYIDLTNPTGRTEAWAAIGMALEDAINGDNEALLKILKDTPATVRAEAEILRDAGLLSDNDILKLEKLADSYPNDITTQKMLKTVFSDLGDKTWFPGDSTGPDFPAVASDAANKYTKPTVDQLATARITGDGPTEDGRAMWYWGEIDVNGHEQRVILRPLDDNLTNNTAVDGARRTTKEIIASQVDGPFGSFPTTDVVTIDGKQYAVQEASGMDLHDFLGNVAKKLGIDTPLDQMSGTQILDLLKQSRPPGLYDAFQTAVAERLIFGDIDPHLSNFTVLWDGKNWVVQNIDLETAFVMNKTPFWRQGTRADADALWSVLGSPDDPAKLSPAVLSKIKDFLDTWDTPEGRQKLRDLGLLDGYGGDKRIDGMFARARWLLQYDEFPPYAAN